jgi:4-hydroxy-3-methylbut-2-enyl diphosphate reductase
MKVISAKNAGFCMGVKRAVDMAVKLAQESAGKIYTYGPLIHNPQVIDDLKKKGVSIFEKGPMPKKGTIIIRTHGITPDTKERFEKSGLKVIDATCPFVKKVQYIIDEYSNKGYEIMIVGDKGHAEVLSYLGYAKGKGIVVSTIEEADVYKKKRRICIVAQTTQDKKIFKHIVDKIKEKKEDVMVFDTICNATRKRQEEALSLSREVEAMVVVGGNNSANTLRLVEICKSAGVPTFFIEKTDDIDVNELKQYQSIGVTAGASTPKEVIQEVGDEIRRKARVKKKRNDYIVLGKPSFGTDFQKKVWCEIKKIPYGKTRTYKEIAEAVGSPNACRAVGQACKRNPLLGYIPCHRVVCSSGKIGGYNRGVNLKKALLNKEKK